MEVNNMHHSLESVGILISREHEKYKKEKLQISPMWFRTFSL